MDQYGKWPKEVYVVYGLGWYVATKVRVNIVGGYMVGRSHTWINVVGGCVVYEPIQHVAQ